ncbi:nitrite reductase small subunit NirD [Desertibacillus haloalkaliphilus]|uniref:nitrite reductase small subunit NirD n=1 Tax=Desertibacillus haloalkaliphilus TaxID=1328930 RepID=UPI001FE3388D|nr:nitrite reductase small subunit NirD [Desertibacillus haloalkaliphilus]
MGKVGSAKRIEVAKVEDLAVGVGKRVELQDEKIALFRLNDDRVHAVQNSCPHKQGPLSEGIVSGDHVFCPLHDWKIDVTDGMVQAPDEGCVKRYDVEVENGTVYIVK